MSRSCHPNPPQRPHLYQLMQEDFLAYFLPFPTLLSQEKVVLGALVSDKFFRFLSRVGQIVGQRKRVGQSSPTGCRSSPAGARDYPMNNPRKVPLQEISAIEQRVRFTDQKLGRCKQR